MTDIESALSQAPSAREEIILKSREIMGIMLARHVQLPNIDQDNSAGLSNGTVLAEVKSDDFTGIALHNVNFDPGFFPNVEASQTLVVAGTRGKDIINFQISGLNGPDMRSTREQDALVALNETLASLTPR